MPSFRSILAVALAACAGCGGESVPAATAQPHAEIADLAALERAVLARRGKPLVVNWWATWCEPCVAELPDLAAAIEAQHGEVQLLTVSYDLMVPGVAREQVVARVERFLAARKLGFEVEVFDGPDFKAVDARFALPGSIPATLAFDAQGTLVAREDGPATRERFDALIAAARGR